MSSQQSTRQQLISTLFTPGSELGSLIAHIKIWEEVLPPPSDPAAEKAKPRYILLAVQRNGRLKLHKSKRNSNGTFSIGKTWNLEDLHAVTVLGPTAFTITFNSRPARWESEHPREQQDFVVSIVRCYRSYTGKDLRSEGFEVADPPGAPAPYLVPGHSNRVSVASSGGGSTGGNRAQTSPGMGTSPRPRPSKTPPGSASQPSLSALRGQRPSVTESVGSGTSSRYTDGRAALGAKRSHEALSVNSRSVTPSGMSPRAPSPSNRAIETRAMQPQRSFDSARSGSRGEMKALSPRTSQEAMSRPRDRRSWEGTPPTARQQSAVAVKEPTRPPRPSQTPPSASREPPRMASRPSTGAESQMSIPTARSVTPVSVRVVAPSPVTTSAAPRAQPAPVLAPAINTIPQRRPLDSIRAVIPEPRKRAPSPVVAKLENEVNGHVKDKDLNASIQMSRSTSRSPSPIASLRAINNIEVEDGATTLANVEEMLEGFEWRNATGGAADRIEQRLVGELQAHEAASIHAIVESDDRVAFIVKHLDEAIAELEKLDQLISLYRTQMNVVNDDIDHIESQNKGLQVQTSNQRALLNELESLLNTINIPDADLRALVQESLEQQSGIDRLEQASASLYKAILSTKSDFAAAAELSSEFQRYSSQFAKRFLDFLTTAFRSQTDKVAQQIPRTVAKNGLEPHQQLQDSLGRYCGLMLFVKETEEQRYQQICGSYFTAASGLYRQEVSALITYFKTQIRKASEDEQEASFVGFNTTSSLTRSVTQKKVAQLRSPPEAKGRSEADLMQGSEAFKRALAQIGPHIHQEQDWVADLLQIRGPDSYFTFAEYMDLETVFRRQASAHLTSMLKGSRDIRASMDLIFGFLPQELNDMIDYCLQRDNLQVVGLLSALDECVQFADGVGSEFLGRTMQRLYQRLIVQMEKMAVRLLRKLDRTPKQRDAQKEQIQAIEATKLTVKKRKGVVPFIQIFPAFIERIEAQLMGCDKYPIRRSVDAMYDDVVKTMFECLQQMAKMGGGDSAEVDKDQLNYHVVLIENMHHFTTTARDLRGPAIRPFAKQAHDLYDENLASYTTLVLRRPLGKHMDFFAALQGLLKTTPPSEVSLHQAFTKSATRRITGSMDAKDLRKAVDALARRIDKHFNDVTNPSAENAQVVTMTWRACQEEAAKLTAMWAGLLGRCYGDQISLGFTQEDVRSAFGSTKPGLA